MNTNVDINERPKPDPELVKIAEYTSDSLSDSDAPFDIAKNCLIDTLGCGFLAFVSRMPHLGPVMANSYFINGSRDPDAI